MEVDIAPELLETLQNDFRIKEIDTMLNELLDQKSVITKNVKNIMNRIRSLIDGKNNVVLNNGNIFTISRHFKNP